MSRIDKLISMYSEKFHEAFPVRMAPTDIDEVEKIIKECVRTGKPYDPYADPDFDPEAMY